MVLEAEVYTLGTRQWRSLGQASYCLDGSNIGAVFWSSDEYKGRLNAAERRIRSSNEIDPDKWYQSHKLRI
ncbi:hypothetical protein OSB04_016314 [Centaurea solstitialis]|uniref:Uncharacterized protein n=1 Tax=Centaurea solstitialis TaxID=347529 RepID=A0AA38T0P5_9ASTR|nr:hypothetical protein OSB04_016314 [Centaurea solstitialis]